MERITLSLKVNLKSRIKIKMHKPHYIEIGSSNVLGKHFEMYVNIDFNLLIHKFFNMPYFVTRTP